MKMSGRINTRAMALAGSACALVLGSPVHAQTAAAPSKAAVVEELVVTAQRREERSVDVPIAIASVSGEKLAAAQVNDYADLGRVLPGVVIGRTGSFAQPSIRGITTQASGAGGENNVATYVDGFYRPFQGSLIMDLDNITQIDALKGPQGTLFGRNATGGAVLIQTQGPTDYARGKASFQYARFNDVRASGDYSGPITDQVSFAINGYVHTGDNYYTEFATGAPAAPIDNFGIGAKVRYQPTDIFSLLLSYEYRQRSDGSPFMYEFVAYQRAKAPPYSPTTFTSTARNVVSLTVPTRVRNIFTDASAKAVLKTPLGDLNSYTSYQTNATKHNFDYDGSAVEFQEIYQSEDANAFQQEVNLVSDPGGSIDYAVGAYYYRMHDFYRYFFLYSTLPAGVIGVPPNGAIPSTATANWIMGWPLGRPGIRAESLAGYADVTWHVSDSLHLTGGLRYTTETQKVSGTVVGFERSETFEDVTPRAVVRYDLDEHSNVYASYSKGFKSGTFNIFSAPFDPVQPEKLTAYEVGYKSAHGNWSLDLDAFYYDYADMQVTAIVTDTGGAPRLQTTNAAKSEIYGLGVQFSIEPIDRLHIQASGGYTHARYQEYDSFSPALPNVVTGLQTTTCAPATPCRTDLAGQQLLKAPDWTANLNADYTWEPAFGPVTASANIAYTSSFMPTSSDWALDPTHVVNNIIQPANSGQRYATPSYTLVSFNLGWQAKENIRLSAFIKNAFDAEYLIVSSGNGNGVFKQWGEPRTYGGRIEYKF